MTDTDDPSERAVYRTSVSTDKANSSRFFFDDPDEAKEFVEQRLDASGGEDTTFDTWREDEEGEWIAYTSDDWIVGTVSRETIHSEAEQALRAREDIYGR